MMPSLLSQLTPLPRCDCRQVHVAPTQWSWPVNLPISWLGLVRGPTANVADSFEGGKFPGPASPWVAEFEQAVLSIPLKVGRFTEVRMRG